MLVSGGSTGNGYLATAEIYDPALGTWSLTGSMSTAATATGHAADGRRVLVSGGVSQSGSIYPLLGHCGNLRSGTGHLVADGLDER